MIPPPRNLLVSYHYYAKYNLDRFASCRVIGDSGAFSAASQGVEITTADLAGWAQRWRHVLTWVASLDVIGDAEGTRRNWHEMVDDHGVQGVPTIHMGCEPSLMDYYAERGVDFVGLGGMVGKPIPRQLRWLVGCFRYARDHHPQMRFHGWGVTATKLLQLPFFSVDSSGWSSSYRYGRLTLRDPATGRQVPVILDGRGSYAPEVVELLRHYGVTPSQIATSGPHNRALLVKLSALSASVGEQHFRRLHRRNPVTAPAWGINLRPVPAGPHQFIAVSASGKQYGEEIADLSGPHQHLALNAKGQEYENDAVADLNGPHQHLVLADGKQPPQACRTFEDDVIAELNAAPGPHLHLVDGSAEHLRIVADMSQSVEVGEQPNE